MSVRERILTLRLLERLSADPTIAADLGLDITQADLRHNSGEELLQKSPAPCNP